VTDIAKLLAQLPGACYGQVQEQGVNIWCAVNQQGQRYRLKWATEKQACYWLRREAYFTRTLPDHLSGQLHGHYQLNGGELLISDWFEGESASDFIRAKSSQGPVRLGPLIGQLRQLHQLGWAHLDVKSNNLIIKRSGELRLLDFASCQAINKQLSQLPYRSYSPSFATLALREGRGEVSPLMDWYGFFIVLRLLHGGGLAKPDQQVPGAINKAFAPWLAAAELEAEDRAFLETQLLALDLLETSASPVAAPHKGWTD